MRRQSAVASGAAVLGIAALAMLALSMRPQPPTAPVADAGGDRPVLTSIKELMASIIDPSADGLWGAVGTVVDTEKGIVEMRPKTDEEWFAVRSAIVRIIEGANLLMMPGRDAAPAGTKSETPGVELEPAEISALLAKDRTRFDGFARALQVLGVEALRASDAKDADSLIEIGGRMENVCESCHQTYWYPNASGPQSGGQ